MRKALKRPRVWLGAALLLAAAVALALASSGCGEEEAKAQTIRFQEPTEPGPDPFTASSDVAGSTRVAPSSGGQSGGGSQPGTATGQDTGGGAGTFGGTGSNRVCDRERLIRQLKAKPDVLRAWADALGIDPTPEAVAAYIRKLRPVTLTRDTQVTNHSFRDGRAVPYQAILKFGTAVLVDEFGKPVVRCRCGNPLKEPVYYPKAKCYGCPPKYKPPPRCRYKTYPKSKYDEEFGGSGLDSTGSSGESFEGSSPKPGSYSNCYVFYPDPPPAEESREPDATVEPEQAAPTPAEPQYDQRQKEQQYTTPEHTQPQQTQPYCDEANAPDRFEPGCQGTLR